MLVATLDVLKGTVLTRCKPRHRHQEFLAFLRKIEAHVLQDQDIHLIVDNRRTHKNARVKAWLARRLGQESQPAGQSTLASYVLSTNSGHALF